MKLIDRLATRALPDATYLGASNAAVILSSSYGAADTERILPTFQSYAAEGYQANGPVFAVILARLNLFTEAEFKFRNVATKKLWGDARLDLLENPWPNGGTGELLARMEQDASLAGNFFAHRAPDRLFRWRPDWVDIIRVPREYKRGWEVAGYIYHPEGRQSDEVELYDVAEVAHWAPIPDPLADFRGMSWLTPVVQEVNGDLSMTAYKRAFFENQATPNALIRYTQKLEKGAIEQITSRWNARYGGPDGWKTAVLDQGADFQVIGNTFEQMSWSKLQGAGETRIASAGGVPAIVAGLKEGLETTNYSMYQQAFRHFADTTMRSNWRTACQALASIIDVPADSRLWFDTSDIAALREGNKELADTMQVNASTASTLLAAGYTSESITNAITAADMTLLVHTGLTSVQLQPPMGGATP